MFCWEQLFCSMRVQLSGRSRSSVLGLGVGVVVGTGAGLNGSAGLRVRFNFGVIGWFGGMRVCVCVCVCAARWFFLDGWGQQIRLPVDHAGFM